MEENPNHVLSVHVYRYPHPDEEYLWAAEFDHHEEEDFYETLGATHFGTLMVMVLNELLVGEE